MNTPSATQLVIPLAGAGLDFKDEGYKVPKPFLPLTDGSGNTVVEQAVDDLIATLGEGGADRIIYLYRAEHSDYIVRSRLNRPDVSCVFIPIFGTTLGPAVTLLQAQPFIDPNLPVVVANAHQVFGLTNGGEFQIPKIVNQAAVTFKVGTAPEPGWSYLDKECMVSSRPDVAPTKNALAGVYWYRRAESMWEGVYQMLAESTHTDLESILNYTGFKTFPVPSSVFIPLGTPKDYETYVDMCLRMRSGTEENAA
jgi:hypothetical protein